MDVEYLCEARLRSLDRHLHALFSNTAFVAYHMLEKYVNFFPDYTDHAVTHSVQVIHFCNALIGEENVKKMNADEIYILLTACYLHDCGMGIPQEEFWRMRNEVVTPEFERTHPDANVREVIRCFHQEFSGRLVKKYAPFFEIPTQGHVDAIAQVSRGHRLVDLYDEEAFPSAFPLENGNTVCLPYLASLIRLADELDIAADRNISFIFPEHDTLDKRRHAAIRRLRIEPDRFVLEIKPDATDLFADIHKALVKLQVTLDLCCDVVDHRTPFRIAQRKVECEPRME